MCAQLQEIYNNQTFKLPVLFNRKQLGNVLWGVKGVLASKTRLAHQGTVISISTTIPVVKHEEMSLSSLVTHFCR